MNEWMNEQIVVHVHINPLNPMFRYDKSLGCNELILSLSMSLTLIQGFVDGSQPLRAHGATRWTRQGERRQRVTSHLQQ